MEPWLKVVFIYCYTIKGGPIHPIIKFGSGYLEILCNFIVILQKSYPRLLKKTLHLFWMKVLDIWTSHPLGTRVLKGLM